MASRYFIGDKQKDELSFNSPKENIQNVINILKDTNSELLKNLFGSYKIIILLQNQFS